VTPKLTIGFQGEYRRYQSLYHLMGVGFGVDFWLGVSNERELYKSSLFEKE
jgi:hypothetical protein